MIIINSGMDVLPDFVPILKCIPVYTSTFFVIESTKLPFDNF